MDQLFLFALLGLGTGALIAGIGLGVVLTYRGSGVINLSTGAVAMVAGYSFCALRTGDFFGSTLATAPAIVVGAPGAVAIGVAGASSCVFRPLRNVVAAGEARRVARRAAHRAGDDRPHHGGGGRDVPVRAPRRTSSSVAGTRIPVDRFWLTGIVIVIAAMLWALYRWTRFGLSTRAASESEASAMLAGLSPNRLALTNTVLATAVAGGDGHPRGAVTQIDTVDVPLQVVPALGAALFARFTSFSITCLVGLLDRRSRSRCSTTRDAELVPDRQRHRAAGRQRAADVPGHRRRAVVARLEPADPRRAGREAAARGPAAGATACARGHLGVVVVVVAADRAAVRLPQRADASRSPAWSSASRSSSSPASSARCRSSQVALAGVAGFAVSHLTGDGRASGSRAAPIGGVAVATACGLHRRRRPRCACAA